MTAALSRQIALRLYQEALQILGQWFGVNLAFKVTELSPNAESSVKWAKTQMGWSASSQPEPLQLVFDQIHLRHESAPSHYWPVGAISSDKPTIPYPAHQPDLTLLGSLKQKVQRTLSSNNFTETDWGNLSLLMLILEKYGAYLSFGESDVALFDRVRITAAVAASLGDTPDTDELCLVAGDLSGIQPFIYTIASDGALKSLRARSFYLELVAEELTQQLLGRI